MKFSKDMQKGMKDCIIALIWSKKEIIEFFISNGCTKTDIRNVREYTKIQ
jgi:hypothetical protein